MRLFILSVTALAVAHAPVSAQLATITNQPTSRALWAGGNVIFAVGVSNSGAYSYQWQFNSTNLPNGIITTVVGNGTNGHSGDAGLAVNAELYGAADLAVDPAGNLFVADYGSQPFGYIRKVDTNGIISPVAGNGASGFSGNNGPATNASLDFPKGVTLDAKGNLFITDAQTCLIRKVDTNGIITIVAGNGPGSFSGDGGLATNAYLQQPSAVTVDSAGNVFVSDGGHNRIRKVDTNGIITTIAGNGTAALSGDGGMATNASLSQPEGVVVDGSGNLFIADYVNNRIREVSTDGIITTVAGNGPTDFPNSKFGGDGGAATNAFLSAPFGVAVDAAGDLYIVDQGNSRIREVDANGIITTVAGNGTFAYSGDGGLATNASLYLPTCVTVDAFGNLFISDDFNSRFRKVTNTRGPALALNAVTPANSGNYQLVVTWPGGSVTSSIVNLTVTTTPLIYQTVRNSDGSVMLNFVSQPGSTNVVLCATSLSSPITWQTLSTNLAGPDGNWHFTDTNAASYGTRFYRSLQQGF